MTAYRRVGGTMMILVGIAGVFTGVSAAIRLAEGVVAAMTGQPMGYWHAFMALLVGTAGLGMGYGFLRRGRGLYRGDDMGPRSEAAPSAGAQPPTAGTALPDPVPVPGEAEVLSLEAPVRACPRCGFLGIRAAELGDGVWLGGGELIYRVCGRCGFRGQPVAFETGEDYRRFLEALWEDRGADGTPPTSP